jgi:hypothetical protein
MGCRRRARTSTARATRSTATGRVELTVELVSYRFHASRRAFEQDVARRRRSFTYGDVFERGTSTAAELRRWLQRVAGGGVLTPPDGYQ